MRAGQACPSPCLPGRSRPGSLGAGSTATSGGRRSSPRSGPAHGCRPEATAAPLPFSVPNPQPPTPWPSIAPEVNGVTTHPGGTLTLKWDSLSGLEAPPADVAVVGMELPGRGTLGEVRSRHPKASLPDVEAGGRTPHSLAPPVLGADAPRVPCSSRSASRSTSKGPRAAHPSDRQLGGALVRVLLPLPLGRERRPGTQPWGTAPGSPQRAASSPRLIPLASLQRRKTCRKCREVGPTCPAGQL